jgi:hypothetical protein
VKWSWLQNPAVALIELLASVIAVGQSAAWLCRYIYRLARAEGEQYRGVRIAAALVALVMVVAFSVVTWPAIAAEAAKTGTGGVLGALYPTSMDLLAFTGAAMLLDDARARRRFSLMWCGVLFAGIGTAAMTALIYSGLHGWVGGMAAAGPGVVVCAITPFMITRWARLET